jgi:hypothetical protein
VQGGYERTLGSTYSLGIQGAFYSDHRAESAAGWHVTLLGRHYFRHQAPFGLYAQGQVSVYEHQQTWSLIATEQNQTGARELEYSWRGHGAGVGVGIGNRQPIFQQAFQGRLALDAMAGLRFNPRPRPQHDPAMYQPASAIIPQGTEWYWIGPGSAFHGLLAVSYSF